MENKMSTKTLVSAWIVAAALGGANAFAQGTAGTATSPGSGSGTSSATGPAGTTGGATAGSTSRSANRAGDSNLDRGDARFVRDAAMSNMAEIETSKLALQKASDPKVKQYAQHMIDDHTKASQRLMSLASSKGVQPDTSLDRKHERAMDKLSKASGADFDKQYLRLHEDDHEKTVKLFEKQAKNGKDADLKRFAEELVPNLRQHLQQVRDLRGSGKRATGEGKRASASHDSHQSSR